MSPKPIPYLPTVEGKKLLVFHLYLDAEQQLQTTYVPAITSSETHQAQQLLGHQQKR